MERSLQKWFNLPADIYCGVLVKTRLFKRVLKLQLEYEHKLRELLANNLDELEEAHWTMARKEGKEAVYCKFFSGSTDEEKLKRIKLFQMKRPEPVDLVLENATYQEAKDYLESLLEQEVD